MDAINITADQIKSKKEVGILNKMPVYLLTCKGGLQAMVSPQGNKVKYLGVGAHVALARYIAEKNEPTLTWTELSKSNDGITAEMFKEIIPEYEALTKKMNDLAD